jgi:Domain of unknown function (DUF1854)
VSDKEKTESSELTIRWLEPGEVSATWDSASARLAVRLKDSDEVTDAAATLAFPVSRPGRFVELSDAKKKSLGMLRSLDGLARDARAAIETALETRYMIPEIESILELGERSPFVLRWRVATTRGERVFFTESPREAVKYQGPGRIRITDLTGNHYDVPGIDALPAESRALLDAYL